MIIALLLVIGACKSGDGDGNGDAADDGGETPGDGGDCLETEVHEGEATWYELAGNPVNCGFAVDTLPPYYAAINGPQYGAADYCGACLAVDGPSGSVELLIVDQCPGCAFGDIDLSPAAFEQIAELDAGRVDASWRVVPCSEAPATLGYKFKDGSSQWWTAVQVVGHRTPLASFAYRKDGEWVEVERLDYNYFVEDQGMGTGPLDFRVTDVFGRSVEDSGITLVADESVIAGGSQFPGCE